MRGKGFEPGFHFPVHMFKVGFQNPPIAQGIAVVEHFLEMVPAKSGLIGGFPHIAFHIRRAGAQHEVQQILFHIPLNIAKRAFIIGVYRIV